VVGVHVVLIIEFVAENFLGALPRDEVGCGGGGHSPRRPATPRTEAVAVEGEHVPPPGLGDFLEVVDVHEGERVVLEDEGDASWIRVEERFEGDEVGVGARHVGVGHEASSVACEMSFDVFLGDFIVGERSDPHGEDAHLPETFGLRVEPRALGIEVDDVRREVHHHFI